MSSFKNFLKKYKVEKGSQFTHTSLGEPKGSYYIGGDIQEDFYELYATAMENGEVLHITEKHRDISPVLIDLDFKQQTADRLYNDDMIVKFLNAVKNNLLDYVDCQNMTFYVMEKGVEARPNKSGGFKDGLHIVVPDVVTKPELQYIIRENIIKNNMQDIFGATFTNKYEDIYDKSVISSNGWFMYGSKKPEEEYAWAVAKVFNVSMFDGVLKEDECDLSEHQLICELSIRNKFTASKIKHYKVEEVKQWKEKNEKPTNNDGDNKGVVHHIPSSCETIVKLVKMLNIERADDYHQWIAVGACLYNINTDLLGLWEEFSKQSHKYTDTGDNSCESKWRSFGSSRNKTTEGTLRYWAKEDNPDAYAELQKKDVSNLIYLSKNETHTDIAKVVHHMYKDTYVCCFINEKPFWYEFKGHRWIECPNAVSLRTHLSHGVSKMYSIAAAQYNLKASESEVDAEQNIFSEIAKKLNGIAVKLKNAPFKANIIKECQEFFAVSKNEFYDLLDENKYLLGFENGVYDFENRIFRDGMPTDYLTFSTGYDFTKNINKKLEAIINKFMFSMHEDGKMVEYMWNSSAYAICGDKYLEMFELYTGSGANSKGTFGKLLKNAFGDYYYEPNVSVFTCKKTSSSSANPELAKTKGKRFVMASEPEETDKFQVGAIKSWTGGDLIQARELFKNNIEFQCQFKIAIQMNNKPKLSNVDGGIARRIRMVHFPFKFVEEPVLANERKGDNTLKKRFETDKELAQTFMMMLIQKYNENIYGNKVFPIPNKVKEATDAYLDENNKIKKFLAECVEVTNDENDMVLSKVLFEEVYKMSEYYENERKDWFVEKMNFNGFESVAQTKRTLAFYQKKVYKGMKLKQNQCEIESEDEL